MLFQKRKILVLVVYTFTLFESGSTTTCSYRYGDESFVLYWKNFCFPTEKNITHIAAEYKEQACRFYCDRVTSCLFYQYQDAVTRCALCVFYYTDVQQHQLQVNDVIQSTTVRKKTAHEVADTRWHNACVAGSYGSFVQANGATNFHYGLDPYTAGK